MGGICSVKNEGVKTNDGDQKVPGPIDTSTEAVISC